VRLTIVGCGRPPLAEVGEVEILSGYANPSVDDAGAAYVAMRGTADQPTHCSRPAARRAAAEC
jgi:hypothetical protein